MGEKVEQALVDAFGSEKGSHLYRVIWPSVLMDFYKTVGTADIGVEVTEEYRLDDHTGRITLVGRRQGRGGKAPEILAISINDVSVWEDRSE